MTYEGDRREEPGTTPYGRITDYYERAFQDNPHRAAIAEQRARNVVRTIVAELGIGEAPGSEGLGRLQRALAWVVFDYSVARREYAVSAVGAETLNGMISRNLVSGKIGEIVDFGQVVQGIEDSVLLMRQHREQQGHEWTLGDPDEAFIRDFEAVVGPTMHGVN